MSCGCSAPVVGRGGTIATGPRGVAVDVPEDWPGVANVGGRDVVAAPAPDAGPVPRTCRLSASTRVLSSSTRLESVVRVTLRVLTWRVEVALLCDVLSA